MWDGLGLQRRILSQGICSLTDVEWPHLGHAGSVQASPQYTATRCHTPWPSANADPSTNKAPAARTSAVPVSACAGEPARCNQRQSHGAATRPADEASAKPAIAAAPPTALPASEATINADCNKPQGQATHSPPAAAARNGPRIGCHPLAAVPAAGMAAERPMADIQPG